MGELHTLDEDDPYGDLFHRGAPRDTTIQILFSLALGTSAFLAFCVLRPRWTALYAARKKQRDEASALPDLPGSLFGWIWPVWKISDRQVLASAGLDAYVFLTFFKLAIKFLLATLFFSLIVIKPVHDAYPEDEDRHPNETRSDALAARLDPGRSTLLFHASSNSTLPRLPELMETDYLWMYLFFAYLFSAIAIYLIFTHTRKVIAVRQEHLGTQTTLTDRTIRLSGVPIELRDEKKIKDFLEDLHIGSVESVTLCRDWRKLDEAMGTRLNTLRKLEEAHTIHQGHRTIERNLETLPITQPAPPHPQVQSASDEGDEENDAERLIDTTAHPHQRPYARVRPQATLRYGFLKLHSKKVDAIEYYEEKLRQADEEIKRLRKERFEPTSLAFVTMDSVAACQMAIQAVLDPAPLQLIAKQSPAPSDVIWHNTYLSRRNRQIRAWSVTVVISFLTLFWSVALVPVATLLNVEAIGKVFPNFSDFLDEHENIRSLVNTQVPTLIATLLMVLVPYLYYWLSWYQGQISRGDIELSAISKNFFFTFFNFFIVFTILGATSNLFQFFEKFGEVLQDLRRTAYSLAVSLQGLLSFYVNFILLQGVGLFPFRLLEAGSVSLYPIYLMGAKTPRDYAELVQPPVFSYGFYLPSALVIFIICMVYSVLRMSWRVLLAGLAYFALGHFVYKYQLLYAMDHRQQSSGSAWGMICDRIFVGLIFFQLSTAGQLLLNRAVTRAVLMIPLVVATVWISIAYRRMYRPLMKHIALASVRRPPERPPPPLVDLGASNSPAPDSRPATPGLAGPEHNVWADIYRVPQDDAASGDERVSEGQKSQENELRFVNPSLVAPLDDLWVHERARHSHATEEEDRYTD